VDKVLDRNGVSVSGTNPLNWLSSRFWRCSPRSFCCRCSQSRFFRESRYDPHKLFLIFSPVALSLILRVNGIGIGTPSRAVVNVS
jgi:hypothetical protein